MNRYLIILVVLLPHMWLMAQDSEGSYNPYVNAGTISPAPLYPHQANGTGTINFNFGNSGDDPLEIYADQFITLTLTLSYGESNSTDPLDAVGGIAAELFTWTYAEGTYTAIQRELIPASYSGTITIDYKVIQNSVSPGLNGFNVNISPAPYQTNSNSMDDDAVSSYTYTEIRDYGDAPESFGEAYHIIDFTRYLGELIDGEDDNQPSAAADADDLNGLADEDGVEFPDEMYRGETVDIPVTVAGMGYMNVWIDWNGDGDFNDSNEYVVNNVQRSTGTANISITVPENAIITQPTFARFRFSTETLTSPIGGAIGGEVEDYQIMFLSIIPDVTPTLIVRPNIMNGPTTFDLIVRVTELNGRETEGPVIVNVPKDPRWLLTEGFVQSLTSLGGTDLNNNVWSYSDDADNHIFTMTSSIMASESSTFGFRVTFDPANSNGFYTITAQIVSGAGGEVQVSNNADSEKIDYFQQ